MLNEYQHYKLALTELKRVLTENAEIQTPWNERVRDNAFKNGYWQLKERFSPVREDGVGHAMIAYAKAMHSIVKVARDDAFRRDEYNPVATSMDATELEARMLMDSISTRSIGNLRVMCRKNGGMVYKLRGNTEVVVGPMWRRYVRDNDIAIVEWKNKPTFIVSARRKSSTFLAEDGIAVWDAYGYTPSGTAPCSQGFVFKADVTNGRIALFHEDFMRGAALIRKRVRNAVMSAMGID